MEFARHLGHLDRILVRESLKSEYCVPDNVLKPLRINGRCLPYLLAIKYARLIYVHEFSIAKVLEALRNVAHLI